MLGHIFPRSYFSHTRKHTILFFTFSECDIHVCPKQNGKRKSHFSQIHAFSVTKYVFHHQHYYHHPFDGQIKNYYCPELDICQSVYLNFWQCNGSLLFFFWWAKYKHKQFHEWDGLLYSLVMHCQTAKDLLLITLPGMCLLGAGAVFLRLLLLAPAATAAATDHVLL